MSRSRDWSNRKGSTARAVEVHCDACGKPLTRYKSKVLAHNFCGFECAGQWRSVHLAGEDNARWNGGHPGYRGRNWHSARKEALDRDGYECQVCGSTSRLQVHHLRPFELFDSYEEANRLDNLQTLCLPCHRRADGELRAAGLAPPARGRIVPCQQCGADFRRIGNARYCGECRPRRRAA